MKAKSKAVSVVLFLSVFILVISSGEQEVERKKNIKHENEVRVIKNSKEFSIQRLKLLSKFGGMNVAENQIFNNPVDIAVCKKGRIYILDSKDNNIKIFREDGSFIKYFSREGSGPGEFKRPWILDILEEEIYVADTGNRRIQVFTKDGQYLRSFKAPVDFGQGMRFDSKGNIYLNTKGFRSPKIISVYNSKGHFIREIGDLEGKSFEFFDFTLIKKQIRNGEIPDSFKNDLLLIVDNNGYIFAVHRALNKFKKYSSKGELFAEVEIKTEEYNKIYKSFLEKNESEKNPSIFWPLYYVNDLAVDEKGNLYILLNDPSRMTIYVYSNDGKFKVKLIGVGDRIFRIAISSNEYLYALSQETHFIYKFKLDFDKLGKKQALHR